MDTRQVEDVVKKAISYAEEAPRRSRQEKRRLGLIYGICLILALAEVAALYFLTVRLALPETKGRSLEEIERSFAEGEKENGE